MSGYLAYEAWNEHLADLQRAAAVNRRIERRRQRPADRPVRTGLRRLRQALAA
jgi:putative component of toxin-antitoxin plasmid stabilization module